jgi:uncharacterized tellurite resistance protein B-like protein
VRDHLPEADAETVSIVVSVAGLLASVAYADCDFSNSEEEHVVAELGRVRGLSQAGARTIALALREHARELAALQTPRYTRELRRLADRGLRREVLSVLIDLAAADGTISLDEVNQLRQLTEALGLNQSDYNQLQSRHRDKLSSLR